ncbi:hypothetical protein EI94DRAFT_1803281 [Lactarius quietus]|nr:hypothetical protein EI94DRAFT_1803281 [Lactarius quietus]
MSTLSSSPTHSPKPIDISTPPPPSVSPPPLPPSPPSLLSCIQVEPTVLTLKECINISEEEAPALMLKQMLAIEAIVEAPLPILTREQIDKQLVELMETGHSLSHSTDGSGQGPSYNAYDNPQFVPPHFMEKADEGSFASITTTETMSTMSMLVEGTPTPLIAPTAGSWKLPLSLTMSPLPLK